MRKFTGNELFNFQILHKLQKKDQKNQTFLDVLNLKVFFPNLYLKMLLQSR